MTFSRLMPPSTAWIRLGAADSLFGGSYYKQFLKGVTKPNQARFGNLALQVLAVQSGGLALPPSNEIAPMVRECLKASAPYYEISFDPPPPKQAGAYHHLEVKLVESGLLELKVGQTGLTRAPSRVITRNRRGGS